MAGALLPADTTAVVQVLVVVAIVAAWWLVAHIMHRQTFRPRWPRTPSAFRREIREEAVWYAYTGAPLFRHDVPGVDGYPKDPRALVIPVVVPPLGDGRPGERFTAPAEPLPDVGLRTDGSRQDAEIMLASGVALVVDCLGRVGAVRGGSVLEPAAGRCHRIRALSGLVPAGEVVPLQTPAGPAWRHEVHIGNRFIIETHLDHGGWAYVIRVTGQPWARGVIGVVDSVLATWAWIDEAGVPAPEAAHPALPADPCADAVSVVVGRAESPLATFRAPGPRLADAPAVAFDGARTEAVVPLTATAHLAVTSQPLDRTAAERLAAAAASRIGRIRVPAGPVLGGETGAGATVCRRFVEGGLMIHEAYVDGADRGWTIRLVCEPDDELRLLPAFNRMLLTWRWADGAVASVDGIVVQQPLANPQNPI